MATKEITSIELPQLDYKVTTCYNCQDKFFVLTSALKSINFCADCWAK